MKAYIPNYNDYTDPDEMEKILNYLNSNGRLTISNREVESYYEWYSDDVWCAGWMSVNDEILESFANWLSEKEVE